MSLETAGGRDANTGKKLERKLFHNVYRFVSGFCLSHILVLHKDFAMTFCAAGQHLYCKAENQDVGPLV